MAARNSHKKVTWKVGPAVKRELFPRPYVPDAELHPEHLAALEGKLFPGSMFVTRRYMAVENSSNLKPAPYPYLFEAFAGDGFPESSIAIYAGTVRVEETNGSTVIRTPRHTFIIAGKRFLTTNLNNFSPI